MKIRHKIVWAVIRPLVMLFLWIKFGYTFKVAKDLPENYIVLANHATDFDPIFVGVSFRKQMYFVASEHIARWPNAYKFLKWGFEPIMRYKGSVAASTVMEVLRKARRGENVMMFAEGVRTWDGVTNPILPATGKMVKGAGCGLVTYKLRGGYFTSPMWSTSGTRKGPIHGEVVNVYTKEQIADMSNDEVNAIINRDLYEDAYERQLEDRFVYKGKALAEGMENLLFICPECGGHDTFTSSGNTVTCENCGHSFVYNEMGMLEGSPFKTVKDLAAWQRDEVRKAAENGEAYTASGAKLSLVSKHQESFLCEGPVKMDRESITCGSETVPLSEISEFAMHGKRALVFSAGKKYYELIPEKGNNAIKFQYLFSEYKKLN